MEFKTTLKRSYYGKMENEVSEYHLSEYLGINKLLDVSLEEASITVKWWAELEVREWGIKSLDTGVREVAGDIRWSVSGEELTEEDKASLKAAGGVEMNNGDWEGSVEIKDWENKWEVEVPDLAVNGGCCLYPKDIELDFKRKVCTIQ